MLGRAERHLGQLLSSTPANRVQGLALESHQLTARKPAPGIELPPEFTWRDYTIFLLTIAAQIEHSLMVQYLYAGYSRPGNIKAMSPRGANSSWGSPRSRIDAPCDLRTPLACDAPCIFQPHRIRAIDADRAAFRVCPCGEPCVQDEGDLSGFAAPCGVGILGVADPDAEAAKAGVELLDALAARCRWKRA